MSNNIFLRYIYGILLIFIISGSFAVAAQGSRTVRENLAVPDNDKGSRIIVNEKGEAGSIVRMLESSRTESTVKGYRVCILVDNSQNARAAATSASARFKEMYPDTPVYVNYRTPDWKVTAGNFLTNEEAITLWGKIKNSFPKAFVVSENITLSSLAE